MALVFNTGDQSPQLGGSLFDFNTGLSPVPASAASPAATAVAPKYLTGATTTFGRNLDGSVDGQDNGQGAWGANTRDPNLLGVSLPISMLRAKYGDENAANGKMVEVVNPRTGQKATVPIVDKGPGEDTGNMMDLTYGLAKQLGSTGKDQFQMRFVDGHTPDWSPATPGSPDSPASFERADPGQNPGSGASGGELQKIVTNLFNGTGNGSNGGYLTPGTNASSNPLSQTPGSRNWAAMGQRMGGGGNGAPAPQPSISDQASLVAANGFAKLTADVARQDSGKANAAALDQALRFYSPKAGAT